MTGMMTERKSERERGSGSVGGGRTDGCARGCLHVYVSSQPKPQPVCTDRVQAECLRQSFTQPPMGTDAASAETLHCQELGATKGAGREPFPQLADPPPPGSDLN